MSRVGSQTHSWPTSRATSNAARVEGARACPHVRRDPAPAGLSGPATCSGRTFSETESKEPDRCAPSPRQQLGDILGTTSQHTKKTCTREKKPAPRRCVQPPGQREPRGPRWGGGGCAGEVCCQRPRANGKHKHRTWAWLILGPGTGGRAGRGTECGLSTTDVDD